MLNFYIFGRVWLDYCNNEGGRIKFIGEPFPESFYYGKRHSRLNQFVPNF